MMKYLFSSTQLKLLKTLQRNSTLFAFDFDGTLAKIVQVPMRAKMNKKTSELLKALNQVAEVAVISGRSIQNLKTKFNFRPKYLIGNHGLEGTNSNRVKLAKMKKVCSNWKKQLNAKIGELQLQDQLMIEDKRYSLTLHYRQAKNRALAKKRAQSLIQELSPAPRVILGKAVFNLVPEGSPNKGSALLDLMLQTEASHVFFIGDDVTDEDVFHLRNSRFFTVRVGKNSKSKAKFFIRNQSEIERLLRFLVKAAQ
jgi:trehalose 6-phosphate phosphatase